MVCLHFNYMDALLVIGDLLHILSLLFLIFRIVANSSTRGLSYWTQQIFLLVFLTRFSDIIIFEHPFPLYLLLTRTLLLAATIITICYLRLIKPHSNVTHQRCRLLIRNWIHFRIYGSMWEQRSSPFQYPNIDLFMDIYGPSQFGPKLEPSCPSYICYSRKQSLPI
jgi:hypothetical protein